MSSWRPEGWVNPHIDKRAKTEGFPDSPFEVVFEAGADAIVRELEMTGYPYDDNRIRNLGTLLEWFAQVAKGKKGHFCFIEEGK